MKKWAVLLLVVVVFCLCGCSKNTDTNSLSVYEMVDNEKGGFSL